MRVELLKSLGLDRLEPLRGDAESMAGRLPALLTEAERIARTVHYGTHGRRRPGPGETFWQFRSYEPGESASRIDWRQSARSQQLYVRELEWEAAQSVWIWPDLSPSMAYRSDNSRPFKCDRAAVLALAVVSLLTKAGERVALLGSGQPPASGSFGKNRFFENFRDRLQNPQSIPPVSDLPPHARIVLISDFLGEPEELDTSLKGFSARGAQLVSVQVNDPVEESFPFDGRVLFEGAEDDGQALFGQAGSIKQRYVELFEARRSQLRDQHVRSGWTFGVHKTSQTAASGLLFLHAALAPSPWG